MRSKFSSILLSLYYLNHHILTLSRKRSEIQIEMYFFKTALEDQQYIQDLLINKYKYKNTSTGTGLCEITETIQD